MQTSRFDKFIWRLNGILILVTCFSVIPLIFFSGYFVYRELANKEYVSSVVNISDQSKDPEKVKEEFKLEQFENILGTDLLQARLVGEQNYLQGYFDKSAGSTRNELFYNTNSQKYRWLFPNNSSLILQEFALWEDPSLLDQNGNMPVSVLYCSSKSSEATSETKKGKVIGHLYLIVNSDTNKNSRLSKDDKKSLVLFSFSDSDPQVIVEGIDQFYKVKQNSPSQALLFYRIDSKNYAQNINIESGKVEEKIEILSPENHKDKLKLP